jgi:hypothetical protein
MKYSINGLCISIKYLRYESMSCLPTDNRGQPPNGNVVNANRISKDQ